MDKIRKLTEEILMEFSLLGKKKVAPNVIDEDFLNKVKSEELKVKRLKIDTLDKTCIREYKERCDVELGSIEKIFNTACKLNVKCDSEILKFFKENFTIEDLTKDISVRSKEEHARITTKFNNFFNKMPVSECIKLDDYMFEGNSIFRHNQIKGSNRENFSTKMLPEMIEDYIKLTEIIESDKYKRLKDKLDKIEKTPDIFKRLQDLYKYYDESEMWFPDLINTFVNNEKIFYLIFYIRKEVEYLIRSVTDYRDKLGTTIRKLYRIS